MKIYISADIEGISGVVDGSFTSEEGYNYQRARELMTGEVNAAIRGLKQQGITDILVNDSHGPMTNILIEKLDEDARLISGNKKLLGMMEGIDESYDAVMLVGYHAKHNTSGVLAHSYNGSVIHEIKINGQTVGEFEFNSLIAGYYDVPVILVSGDDELSRQVKAYNEEIESIVVKRACSRYTAECLQPKKVHSLLEEGVKNSISRIEAIKPCKLSGKVELEVAFANSGMAEMCMFIPGAELSAPNRIKYAAKDILEAYKIRIAFTTLAASTIKR